MEKKSELVKNQKKLQMALSAGNMGTWEWNLKTNKVVWSSQLEHIHGLKKGDFGGTFKSFLADVHPQDLASLRKTIKTAMKNKKKYAVQYRIVTPEGKVRWLEAHGQVVTRNGEPIGMVGVCTDISSQKKAEENILQSTRQLKAVFQSVPEGLTVENRNGEVVYANEAVAQLFKVESQSFMVSQNIRKVFKNYHIFNHKNEKISLNQMPASLVFRTKRDHQARYLFIHKKSKEQMWIDITATPVIKGEDRVGLVVKVFRDMTQVVEDQRQREIYLGMVGHELKNPLASIKAYIGLMKIRLQKKDYSKLNESMESINEQTERLIHLIGDMMDVTRIRAGKLELNKKRVGINSLVRKVVSDIKIADDGHKISIRTPKKETYTKVDAQRLTQVLTNLVTNAQKFSPLGSKIYISVSRTKGEVVINVRDEGYGIPKKQRRYIFHLYSQISNKKVKGRSGLGMGLFISQAIVKAHGGKISLESKVNKGSTFSVHLPS